MTETKDKVIIQVKGSQKVVQIPLYGTVQLEVVNGKIVNANITEKQKYY